MTYALGYMVLFVISVSDAAVTVMSIRKFKLVEVTAASLATESLGTAQKGQVILAFLNKRGNAL